MKKNRRLLSIAIICLLIVIIVAGYYYYQPYQNKTLMLYGNVDIRTVNLSFRVNGKLQTLNVDEGDKISAGQILASLDNTSK